MRKSLAGLMAVAAVLTFGGPAFARTMTVKGQVVDEGCSVKAMPNGGHAKVEGMDQCAIDCAKKGEPVALLTADGKVYCIGGGLAANKNAKLVAHMNHTVEITGDVTEQDGKVIIAADSLKMAK